MKIELLTIDGCPHTTETLSRIETIVDESGITADVLHIVVHDEEMARRMRFPGSPTIRVNGNDVEPTSGGVGLACRVYRDGDSVSGVPPVALIKAAIAHSGA
jgi:glutaredoxin